MTPNATKYLSALKTADLTPRLGKVRQYLGAVVTASGPDVTLGELCEIYPPHRLDPVKAEVVGFRDGDVLFMPYGDLKGIKPGSEIIATGRTAEIQVGNQLLGRIVDAFGKPLDGKPLIGLESYRSIYAEPLNPVMRDRVTRVFETKVKAIDSLLTMGEGQRIGIFAGSGVGKSALMGMITQSSAADINVIALIGERGRELRDFVENHLGDALKRSVVVVATAEQSALVRAHAAHTATAIAEHFRDQGKSVALLLDSLTRFAMAQREVGLAIGEPPTARGYTPSVFAAMPKLLERAGPGIAGKGSITAFYTVLVEGDDLNEPISDHARSILDGHFVLSRDIANRGRYPAFDISKSISRLLSQLVDRREQALVTECIELMAEYEASRDLVELGAYKAGTNKRIDRAIELVPRIEDFLKQAVHEVLGRDQAIRSLAELLGAKEK